MCEKERERESACVRERDRDVYMCMWKGALGGVSV